MVGRLIDAHQNSQRHCTGVACETDIPGLESDNNSHLLPSMDHLPPTQVVTLDQCAKGDALRVVDLLPQPKFGQQDPQVSLRLKELGFLPGALLQLIGFGLMGRDPLAVQINGTKFALRRTEAAKIQVEAIQPREPPNHKGHPHE